MRRSAKCMILLDLHRLCCVVNRKHTGPWFNWYIVGFCLAFLPGQTRRAEREKARKRYLCRHRHKYLFHAKASYIFCLAFFTQVDYTVVTFISKGLRYLSADKKCSYFSNRECEYFPCHPGAAPENFNCLFCWCPLYLLGPRCGGNFVIRPDGRKDCTGCLYPHQRESYGEIVCRYSEIAEAMPSE